MIWALEPGVKRVKILVDLIHQSVNDRARI